MKTVNTNRVGAHPAINRLEAAGFSLRTPREALAMQLLKYACWWTTNEPASEGILWSHAAAQHLGLEYGNVSHQWWNDCEAFQFNMSVLILLERELLLADHSATFTVDPATNIQSAQQKGA